MNNYKSQGQTFEEARANAEVEASLNSLIQRTGIKALGMKPLELEDKG